MSDKAGRESQYLISCPELDSDPPIGSDRDSGRDMSSMALILSRFASILWLLTMKPKNFPVETPKAHLVGFNFIL